MQYVVFTLSSILVKDFGNSNPNISRNVNTTSWNLCMHQWTVKLNGCMFRVYCTECCYYRRNSQHVRMPPLHAGVSSDFLAYFLSDFSLLFLSIRMFSLISFANRLWQARWFGMKTTSRENGKEIKCQTRERKTQQKCDKFKNFLDLFNFEAILDIKALDFIE
mgnify:CR=1 FL=1